MSEYKSLFHMRMKYLLCLLFIVPLLGFIFSKEKDPNVQVDDFMKEKMKEFAIPGAAVAVIKDGNVIKLSAYGYGNLEWQQAATLHTNFQIASCTKLFTSTIVMKAVYEKKLSLEDEIAEYIDNVPSHWKGIKIKHLLTHTSGIPFFNDASQENYTTSQVVNFLKDSALVYPFGTRQTYKSRDFVLLQNILEKIYQKPYEDIVKGIIALPAGMKDGGFEMDQKHQGYTSGVVIPQKSQLYYQDITYKWYYHQYGYAAAGYYASITDMAQWAVALDKEVYFSSAVEDEYVYTRDNISTFSKVGWRVEKEGNITYAGHAGGPGLADILRFPEQGYTFIVLTNDGEVLDRFARAIASFYIKELEPKQLIEVWDWQKEMK